MNLRRTLPALLSLLLFAYGGAISAAAQIVSIEGEGWYREAAGAGWDAAAVDQPLAADSFVRTGELSVMGLLLADRSQIRLRQNTIFQLKRVAVSGERPRGKKRSWKKAGGAKERGETRLRLEKGRAWLKAKGERRRLSVETPSAIAAIHGTGWELAVDETGRSTLTVLSGEVRFYNDHGSVDVVRGEQASAVPGQAPRKYLISNPDERVQWVTAHTVDPARYAELRAGALPEVVAGIEAGRLGAARDALAQRPSPSPVATLLAADFAIFAGDLDGAAALLERGVRAHPDDPRFPAQLTHVELLRDRLEAARRSVERGIARHPDSVELWLAHGALARYLGDAPGATAAYLRSVELAPDDARGWHGLGVVRAEREDIGPARDALTRALALEPKGSEHLAELGTLEGFADRLGASREHFEAALRLRPDDYVALTGLGLLALKEGRAEQALDALLKATLMEPRYARAQLYLGVARYRLGEVEAAQEALTRAMALDEKDPLPHLLASLIHHDLLQPGEALREARTALRLLPNLKSLNQVAVDRQGSANLGAGLAFFGLEDWAMSYAQDSYDPLWAGSHFFLAGRYPGSFAKNSALLQGYLSDPTAFGAANRFSDLVTAPGHHQSAGLQLIHSDEYSAREPALTLNGYLNEGFPLAYFVEAIDTRITPGEIDLDAHGCNLTAALGAKRGDGWGWFGFLSHFDADAERRQGSDTHRTSGDALRLDLGSRYRWGPGSESRLKLGFGDDDFLVESHTVLPTSSQWQRRHYRPLSRDLALQHIMRTDAGVELSGGIEWADNEIDDLQPTRGVVQLLGQPLPFATEVSERREESSRLAYLSARYAADERWRVEGGLFASRYERAIDQRTTFPIEGFPPVAQRDVVDERDLSPRLGATVRIAPGHQLRATLHRWRRGVGDNTLSPLATAGIPFDDRLVQPGGEVERAHLRLEQEWSADTFTTLYLDHQQIENPALPGANLTLAELDRLRNEPLANLASFDPLEGTPQFGRGRVTALGASLAHILNPRLSLYLGYLGSDSESRGTGLEGRRLPYLPRHRAAAGLTLTGHHDDGGRWYLSALAVHRSIRYTDEANTQPLRAGWAGTLRGFWESGDKGWFVDAFAADLFKPDAEPFFGAKLGYRF